jgi:type VI protein secretion system component VasA
MQEFKPGREEPELKALVVEASQALARLDRGRLEELSVSCEALNRNLPALTAAGRGELARQAREAVEDLAVFARVLDATRANLKVMGRLRELRTIRLEYSERQVSGWGGTESGHGNH